MNLRGNRLLLALAPLTLIAAWIMLPVNADSYLTYIYNDPQGAEQNLDAFRSDARAAYTSGLGWAALLALACGVYLGRGARAGEVVRRALGGAVLGLVFAGVTLLVALPFAGPALSDHWAFARQVQDGAPPPTTGPMWPTVLGAVACVVLAGAIGAAFGAGSRRGWLVGVFVGLLFVGSLCVTGMHASVVMAAGAAILGFVPIVVVYLWLDGHAPAAAAALLVTAALALALARQTVAYRERRAASAGA
ncbi:hypothetical protein [Luedemannella helvata]